MIAKTIGIAGKQPKLSPEQYQDFAVEPKTQAANVRIIEKRQGYSLLQRFGSERRRFRRIHGSGVFLQVR